MRDDAADRMKIIACRHVEGHTHEITTESERYGRVTQLVVFFPPSAFDRLDSDDIRPVPDPGTDGDRWEAADSSVFGYVLLAGLVVGLIVVVLNVMVP